ncbi:hypothetical protein [Streptomyces ginkgonis]|uniref:hypothetical protein n=1 Tax=Streptomyces ginkgonis TaxID=1812259 RepID=UPI002176D2AE|nr:hypothetical protein [Streptomyces ginkgonis]
MDLRDSKSRLILIVIALGAALVIAVASCSGGGDGDGGGDGGSASSDTGGGSGGTDDKQPDTGAPEGDEGDAGAEDDTPLAEVTGQGGVRLTITSAERDAGGFFTVSGTLTNDGSERFLEIGWRGDERELTNNGFSMAGSSVVDKVEGKRYLILRDTSGRCLCTQFGSGLNPGDSVEWFAQFPAPPDDATELEFNIGNMPPAPLEISAG